MKFSKTPIVVSIIVFFIYSTSFQAQGQSHKDTLWKEQVPWEGVPEYFQKFDYPDFQFPKTLAAWTKERPNVYDTVKFLLGKIPPRPKHPKVTIVTRETREGYIFEKFLIDNEVDGMIPGYLAIPTNTKGKPPLILGLHSHSYSKDAVFGTVSSSQDVLALLVTHGFALMSIDNSFHGERLGQGPAGANETMEDGYKNQLNSLFKINQWFGRTLWGMQLRDEQIALDYMMTRTEIDTSKIGVEGMSMGSTRSWWLAAIDDRVKAVVAVSCFTRYTELIQQRQINAHGMYTFLPGMLTHFDTEGVMGLIAPRPFLALTGDSDNGSPLSGIHVLENKLYAVYSLYKKPENFKSIVYQHTGHVYTDQMQIEMLHWFEKYLR
ncbi:MAG: alpha/beta hydrolase family protein [Ginsengibacter sp.]